MLKRALRKIARAAGLRPPELPPGKYPIPEDIKDAAFRRLHPLCEEQTFSTPDALYALFAAVGYIVRNRIPGDFVECGVWKGGSAMLMALALKDLGSTERGIHLYDTFDGMSAPTAKDVDCSGNTAGALMNASDKADTKSVWCFSPLEEVKRNMSSTGYPDAKVHFFQGKVEETIPANIPEHISLLHLDTDWYESTRHELVHLYPRLTKGGVLIIDDYGHWQGAREAVDSYFREHNIHILLNRVNYTVRSAIKP